MQIMRTVIIALFPMVCFAYDFAAGWVGAELGYQRQEVHFSYSNNSIPDSKSFKNDLKRIDVLPFGFSAQFFEQKMVYLQAEILFGRCWAHQVDTEMTIRTGSLDQAVSIVLQAPFSHKAWAKPLSMFGEIGYPYRFGPLTFIPIVGYSYDHTEFTRTGITPAMITGANFTASFAPGRAIENKWYTFLGGLKIVCRPSPEDRIRLISGYEFHWGRYSTHCSYQVDSTITQGAGITVNNLKTNLKADRRAWAHVLLLKGVYGITQEWVIALDFRYRYWKAREGSSTQRTQGLQTFTGVPFSQRTVDRATSDPFNGITWQTYSILAEVAYSF